MGKDSKPKESGGKGKGKQAAASGGDENASKGKGKGGKSSDRLGTCTYVKGTMKSVLKALLEVFPQIDLRILKAVAVEFHRDADAAAEFIFSDVLPIIKSQPVETYSTSPAPAPPVLGQDHPLNVVNEAAEGESSVPMEGVAVAEISQNQEETQSVVIFARSPGGG